MTHSASQIMVSSDLSVSDAELLEAAEAALKTSRGNPITTGDIFSELGLRRQGREWNKRYCIASYQRIRAVLTKAGYISITNARNGGKVARYIFVGISMTEVSKA